MVGDGLAEGAAKALLRLLLVEAPSRALNVPWPGGLPDDKKGPLSFRTLQDGTRARGRAFLNHGDESGLVTMSYDLGSRPHEASQA